MQSHSTEAARSRALQALRRGREALARMDVAVQRNRQAEALAECAAARAEQQQLGADLPALHGISCDLAGFHQRLRLLGVARASLLDAAVRVAEAEGRATRHGEEALRAGQRGEQHRRAAERIGRLAQHMSLRARRRAEQLTEQELQELCTWSTP